MSRTRESKDYERIKVRLNALEQEKNRQILISDVKGLAYRLRSLEVNQEVILQSLQGVNGALRT
jgi:hypothetical protein